MAEWMQAVLILGLAMGGIVTAAQGKTIVWQLQRDGQYFIK